MDRLGGQGGSILRRHRECDPERGALAELALDLDLAAVGIDDALHDREAKTDAVIARVLPVAIEDVLDVLARDAGSGVADRDRDPIAAPFGPESDRTAGRGELERVPDQVRERLTEPVTIGEGSMRSP